MDEQTSNDAAHEPELSNVQPEAGTVGGDTRSRLRAEAQNTLNEIRSGDGIMGLFSFEKMYFPFFARVLFMVYCALVVLGGFVLVIGAIGAMVSQGVLYGIGGLILAGLFVVVATILGRIWIELVMVAFSINEAVQDIRAMLRARK